MSKGKWKEEPVKDPVEPSEISTGKEKAEQIRVDYEVEGALEERKRQQDLKKAAEVDSKIARRLAVAERKKKGLELLDQLDSGKVKLVSEGIEARVLRKETILEYTKTFLLSLAVILGKRPVGDLTFDLEGSADKLASGLNKVSPEFAAELEQGSGYADIAIGVAGIGKATWDTIVQPKKESDAEAKEEKSESV